MSRFVLAPCRVSAYILLRRCVIMLIHACVTCPGDLQRDDTTRFLVEVAAATPVPQVTTMVVGIQNQLQRLRRRAALMLACHCRALMALLIGASASRLLPTFRYFSWTLRTRNLLCVQAHADCRYMFMVTGARRCVRQSSSDYPAQCTSWETVLTRCWGRQAMP